MEKEDNMDLHKRFPHVIFAQAGDTNPTPTVAQANQQPQKSAPNNLETANTNNNKAIQEAVQYYQNNGKLPDNVKQDSPNGQRVMAMVNQMNSNTTAAPTAIAGQSASVLPPTSVSAQRAMPPVPPTLPPTMASGNITMMNSSEDNMKWTKDNMEKHDIYTEWSDAVLDEWLESTDFDVPMPNQVPQQNPQQPMPQGAPRPPMPAAPMPPQGQPGPAPAPAPMPAAPQGPAPQMAGSMELKDTTNDGRIDQIDVDGPQGPAQPQAPVVRDGKVFVDPDGPQGPKPEQQVNIDPKMVSSGKGGDDSATVGRDPKDVPNDNPLFNGLDNEKIDKLKNKLTELKARITDDGKLIFTDVPKEITNYFLDNIPAEERNKFESMMNDGKKASEEDKRNGKKPTTRISETGNSAELGEGDVNASEDDFTGMPLSYRIFCESLGNM